MLVTIKFSEGDSLITWNFLLAKLKSMGIPYRYHSGDDVKIVAFNLSPVELATLGLQ